MGKIIPFYRWENSLSSEEFSWYRRPACWFLSQIWVWTLFPASWAPTPSGPAYALKLYQSLGQEAALLDDLTAKWLKLWRLNDNGHLPPNFFFLEQKEQRNFKSIAFKPSKKFQSLPHSIHFFYERMSQSLSHLLGEGVWRSSEGEEHERGLGCWRKSLASELDFLCSPLSVMTLLNYYLLSGTQVAGWWWFHNRAQEKFKQRSLPSQGEGNAQYF